MVNKMPGDEQQRFANLRLLYAYMWTYPGKKLLFMGCEFGQGTEWDSESDLDWYVLEYDHHRGMQTLIEDLNKLYKESPVLHRLDFFAEGFEWIDSNDASQSVISYLRKDGDEHVVVVLNFTPMARRDYRIGVPQAGEYREVLNTDSNRYGGGDNGNAGGVHADEIEWLGHPYSISHTLPPLSALVLMPEGQSA